QAPSAPAHLGTHDLTYFNVPVPARAVHVQGNFAYVAADYGKVQWVDVSDPANMYTAGFNGSLGMSFSADVFIADGFLYSAGNRMVKFAIFPDGSLHALKVSVNFGTRIFVRGDYGYLGGTSASDFVVIDIVGVPQSEFLQTLAVYELDGNVREVVLSGDRAYAVDPFAGITILDASDPVQLTEIGTLEEGQASRLIFGNDYAYTASGSSSRIIDFSDPNNPILVAELGSMAGSVYGVDVEDGYAYLASAGDLGVGLQVLNVADASQPFRIAQVGFPDIALDVEVADGFAYVAARAGGLRVVDISDPAEPFETGAEDGFDYARRLSVQGDYVYVTELQAGVRVVDVSDRSDPHEVAFIPIASSFVQDVYATGSYAYVAADDAGMFVFDVSDPTNPNQVGHIDNVGSAVGVFVLDDLAYVTDFFGDRVRILDVSNPAAPQVIGTYYEAGLVPGRVVADNYTAYVTDAGEGVRVLDVSNPTTPTSEEFIDTPGSAFTVALDAGRIYVADGATGLRIFGTCSNTGDYDGDGDVDLDDYAAFPTCMTGPAVSGVGLGCEVFDFDSNDTVDVFDFAEFQEAFTGSSS
ncbi:MAG: LVIVD repeat-containing protein, partial [Planctomycetota bacterium]